MAAQPNRVALSGPTPSTDGSTFSNPICSQAPGGLSIGSTSADLPLHSASTEFVVPKSMP
ncbi:hypothetical protein ACFQV2_03530 [Actinokineospora soli]|uniref:Uncharacterized protein n=1 Tax=Actinokineospora soli TaxID=1048753 RepID=A0ABW2THZ4_9PSEU